MAFNPKFAASGLIMYDMDHWKTTLGKVRIMVSSHDVDLQSGPVATEGKRSSLSPQMRSRRFSGRYETDRSGR
jgi:hypothetical protein